MVLLAINPLLIHMAPMAKEDIPGMLFTIAIFYFYLKADKTKRLSYCVLTGVSISCAILARYNLIPLFFLLIAVYELGAGRTKLSLHAEGRGLLDPLAWRKYLCYLALPVGAFILVPSLVYALVGLSSLLRAPGLLLSHLLELKQLVATGEDAGQNYAFIYLCMTPGLILLMGLGLVVAIKHRVKYFGLHVLWIVLYFLFQTYYIHHKEARYLFPLFPSFYYFCAVGADALIQRVVRIKLLSVRIVSSIILMTLVFFGPVKAALAEYQRFQDAIYQRNYAQDVSLYAEALSGKEHSIFWAGPYYAITPKDYVFHPEDEFTSVYHFFKHVVQYYTGRAEIKSLRTNQMYPPAFEGGAIFVAPHILRDAEENDVVIINWEPLPYTTATLPATRKPIVVQQIKTHEFKPKTSGGNEWSLDSASLGGARLSINRMGSRVSTTGEGIPKGRYELLMQTDDLEYPFTIAVMDAKNGRYRVATDEFPGKGALLKVILLYYDGVRTFSLPKNE